MSYIEITEEEFDTYTNNRGYTPITKEGVKEKIYCYSFDDIQVHIYSTIENGVTRSSGTDAIRAVLISNKLGIQVGGVSKTLRTGTSPSTIFARLDTKLDELETKGKLLDELYSKIPIYTVIDSEDLIRNFNKLFYILTKKEKGETKKGDVKYKVTFRTNAMSTEHEPYFISFNLKEDDLQEILPPGHEIGSMYQLISITEDYSEYPARYGVYINLGKYGYIFTNRDFYLVDPDIKNIRPIPKPKIPKKTEIPEETPSAKEIVKALDKEQPFDGIPASDTYLKDKYTFTLNPMQTKVWNSEAIQNGHNLIVASPTASGKTVIAELAIIKSINDLNPAIYLTPMKALAEEKYDDWSKLFPTLDIVILTGDYELTEKQKRELKMADIIIMTFEMLNSRCTKHKSEHNTWLNDVGTLIVDEAHLIGTVGRGDKLEVSLMQFTSLNPACQILLLSATLDKLDELTKWVTLLTNRKTVLIESTYRPCKLNVDYHNFRDYKGVWDFKEKFSTTIHILNRNPSDKYIIFCSSRKDSINTAEKLSSFGYKAEFHNATLTLSERKDVEERFKNGDLQIIAATPTLAVGVNMPAKRVIIQSVFRGLNEIDAMEIQQCMGRAGRPKYDTEGYAHVIIPESQSRMQKIRINNVKLISTLSETRDLLFHLNNQIYMGEIQTREQALEWWKRTFAFAISGAEIDILLHLETLKTLGFIEEISDDIDKMVVSTKLGKISAMLYQYPDDVLGWKTKFEDLVKNADFDNDIKVAESMVSMSQLESAYYVASDEKKNVHEFIANYLGQIAITKEEEIRAKYTMHNFWALTDSGMKSVINNIRRDSDRMIACIQMIDAFYGWGEKDEWEKLALRIKHGVPREATNLVKITGVGRKRALKLLDNNIMNASDIVKHDMTVRSLFGDKVGNQIIKTAKYMTGKRKLLRSR